MESGWGNLVSLLDRRADVLDRLADGPTEKRDLVHDLQVSRSTVDRAVRELEAHSLVERSDGDVRITLLGRLALAAHVRYRREVATLDRYGDVLEHLDSSAPLPPWVLVGADLHRPEPPRVTYPKERSRSELEDVGRIRGLTKAITDPLKLDLLRDRLLNGDVDAQFVVTTDVLEHLREKRGEELVRAIGNGGLTLYERESLPFGLIVTDPETPDATVLISIYQNGQLAGTLRNRRTAVVDWALALVETIREDADRLKLTDETSATAATDDSVSR